MTDYQHQIDVMIADTLEKLQPLNPERYGVWYSKLYAPHGDIANWNVRTLHTLEHLTFIYSLPLSVHHQLLIDYAV